MKLFHQLAPIEQDNAVDHCLGIVLEDLIEDGVQLDVITDEDKRVKELLDKALEEIKDIPTYEEKADFLMDNKEIGDIIFDIAVSMSHSTYYLESGEMSIHIPSLTCDHEHCDHGDDEALDTVPSDKKVNHNLN